MSTHYVILGVNQRAGSQSNIEFVESYATLEDAKASIAEGDDDYEDSNWCYDDYEDRWEYGGSVMYMIYKVETIGR